MSDQTREKKAITVARGDGIGPEIMQATLDILDASGANLDIEEIEIGKQVYERGTLNGIEDSAWESLRRTKTFLKAPITTPQGGGFKSLNVTVRKTLGLFANVRPCVAYHPFVETKYPGMDIVIVRENEEDLYGGIEYRPTSQVATAHKLISRAGCDRIVRYAFEYARANGRKKVTCMTKDNIMKIADGMFHATFDEIGQEYPDIVQEHYIIDIGSARIASRPHDFDVIVTENLYGDIISDIAAEITGSVGIGGSSNVGEDYAMFEAIHGSAPDIAGQGIANPSGLILGAVMMLVHIGQGNAAEIIHNAWLKTVEDGIHTGDLYREELSSRKVGTKDFAKALTQRLGEKPETLAPVSYEQAKGAIELAPFKPIEVSKRELVGVDIYVKWDGEFAQGLAESVQENLVEDLNLHLISNRGTKVWPGTQPESRMGDLWRLRFMRMDDYMDIHTIANQLQALDKAGFDFVSLHNLYTYDDEPGFSKAQGE